MTAATLGTRVPASPAELAAERITTAYRQYRAHVMGDCFLCSRNLWCPIETTLGDAHDAAARELADANGR